MKLLQELLLLKEEEEQKEGQPGQKPEENKTPKEKPDMQQKLQDMFDKADGAGDLQPYVNSEIIQMREGNEGEEIQMSFPGMPTKKVLVKKDELVVRFKENPNKIKVVNRKDFEKEYEVAEEQAKPDAEGYVDYRPIGQILAFQYVEHEPLELKDEKGHTIHVKYGDYLGYPIDDSTTLIQLDKSHFTKNYRLAS